MFSDSLLTFRRVLDVQNLFPCHSFSASAAFRRIGRLNVAALLRTFKEHGPFFADRFQRGGGSFDFPFAVQFHAGEVRIFENLFLILRRNAAVFQQFPVGALLFRQRLFRLDLSLIIVVLRLEGVEFGLPAIRVGGFQGIQFFLNTRQFLRVRFELHGQGLLRVHFFPQCGDRVTVSVDDFFHRVGHMLFVYPCFGKNFPHSCFGKRHKIISSSFGGGFCRSIIYKIRGFCGFYQMGPVRWN